MITIKPYAGWKEVLVLSNNQVELYITLDVGPRILRFAYKDGPNIFKEFTDELGKYGEKKCMVRGGHRLWISPELDFTYHPDNSPVRWSKLSDFSVRLQPAPEEPWGWAKELDVTLSPDNNSVQVIHRLKSLKDHATAVAPWALSVLAPGGTAIVPQPALSFHPDDPRAKGLSVDFLPNRRLILWPYTDMSDPRFTWTPKNLLVRQDEKIGPTKIGLLHKQGKAGYQLGDLLFTKTIPYQDGTEYPDFGVNFELFSRQDMLELESLAPLVQLKKGQVVEHTEFWNLRKTGPVDWSVTDLT